MHEKQKEKHDFRSFQVTYKKCFIIAMNMQNIE